MNNSDRKYLNKTLITFAIAALLYMSIQSCSLINVKRADLSRWEIEEFLESQRLTGTLRTLSADGYFYIESSSLNLALPFICQFRTIDTLIVQVKDPMGRKLARMEFFKDEFALLMQRTGEFFSGHELEFPSVDTKFPVMSPRCLRNLMLGLYVSGDKGSIDIEELGSVNEIPDESGFKVEYNLRSNPVEVSKAKFVSIKDKSGFAVIYRNYLKLDDYRIPSEIILENLYEEEKIKIHLSHFSTDLTKL